jgi:hypothetical protein
MTVRGRLGTSVVLINAGNNLGGESGQIAFLFWKKSQLVGSRSSRRSQRSMVDDDLAGSG